MGNFKLSFFCVFFPVILCFVLVTPPVGAAPFTSNFDGLIADLNARAGALSNITDKVEQKQFKAIQKVLKTLNGKTSTSLATDIKNLGKVAKSLAKSFPADFTPPGGSLATSLEAALTGLAEDVQTQINTMQAGLDALPASSCKTKAQTTKVNAQADLDAALATTDFSSAAKLLGTALKEAAKAASSVVKCNSQGGGGGGGGGGGNSSFSCSISGAINDNFSASTGNGFVLAQINHTMRLVTITAGEMQGNTVTHSMTLYADLVDGPGTYPIDFATTVIDYNPYTSFFGAAGTITFSTADFASQKLVGSFAFSEPQQAPVGTGIVTVTSGQFNINDITTADSPPRNDNVMIAEDNRFSFYGPCAGTHVQVGNVLILSAQNEALTYRVIALSVNNPSGPGDYPVGLGSNYFNQNGIYTNSPAGTVHFSALNIPLGLAEGTFTFSVSQTPPSTNTVNVINGSFKNSNIITQ